MAKKVLSVRLDEETLEHLEGACLASKKTQPEFIGEAIEFYNRYQRILRSGGDLVGVQNPQMIEHSEEQARNAVEILAEAASKLTLNHPGLDFGIHYIADFAAVRLYKDSEEKKENFRKEYRKPLMSGQQEIEDQNINRALLEQE